MREKIYCSLVILCSLIIVSCSFSKKFASGDETTAMEKGGDFVQLNDGKIVQTDKITSSFTSKNEVKTANGLTFSWKEIKAFQNNRGYFGKVVRASLNETGYFIPRIIKGAIHVFRSAGESSLVGVDGGNVRKSSFYIQKGADGRLVYLTAGNLRPFVQDYEPALRLLANLGDKADNDKKLEDAILAYNAKP